MAEIKCVLNASVLWLIKPGFKDGSRRSETCRYDCSFPFSLIFCSVDISFVQSLSSFQRREAIIN